MGGDDKNFRNSSTRSTVDVSVANSNRSVRYNGSVRKMACSGGKYITSNCPTNDVPTATTNVLLVVRPMERIDLFMERHAKALNMSKKTKQVNVIVVSRGVIILSCISLQNIHNVPDTMIAELLMICTNNPSDTIGSLTRRGGDFITSLSTGSTPKLCAGGPSIMILIHNICMAFNGLGIFNIVDMATSVSAAMLVLN